MGVCENLLLVGLEARMFRVRDPVPSLAKTQDQRSGSVRKARSYSPQSQTRAVILAALPCRVWCMCDRSCAKNMRYKVRFNVCNQPGAETGSSVIHSGPETAEKQFIIVPG